MQTTFVLILVAILDICCADDTNLRSLRSLQASAWGIGGKGKGKTSKSGMKTPGYNIIIHTTEYAIVDNQLTVEFNSSQAIGYQVSPGNNIIMSPNSSSIASPLAYGKEQHNLVDYTSVSQPNGHVPDSNLSVFTGMNFTSAHDTVLVIGFEQVGGQTNTSDVDQIIGNDNVTNRQLIIDYIPLNSWPGRPWPVGVSEWYQG